MTAFSLTYKAGYQFYLVSFTVALFGLPIVFWTYTLYLVFLCVLYKVAGQVWERCMTHLVRPEGRGVFITGCDTGG